MHFSDVSAWHSDQCQPVSKASGHFFDVNTTEKGTFGTLSHRGILEDSDDDLLLNLELPQVSGVFNSAKRVPQHGNMDETLEDINPPAVAQFDRCFTRAECNFSSTSTSADVNGTVGGTKHAKEEEDGRQCPQTFSQDSDDDLLQSIPWTQMAQCLHSDVSATVVHEDFDNAWPTNQSDSDDDLLQSIPWTQIALSSQRPCCHLCACRY